MHHDNATSHRDQQDDDDKHEYYDNHYHDDEHYNNDNMKMMIIINRMTMIKKNMMIIKITRMMETIMTKIHLFGFGDFFIGDPILQRAVKLFATFSPNSLLPLLEKKAASNLHKMPHGFHGLNYTRRKDILRYSFAL